MRYTYEIEGQAWLIEHCIPSNRWVLSWRVGARWKNVGSYANPDSAALAVANGDTGVTEWDEAPRDAPSFALINWRSHECPPAAMRPLGWVSE